jgi:ribonuclease HI
LADFLVEIMPATNPDLNTPWSLWVDGASNTKGVGAGIILKGPNGVVVERSLRFEFKAYNNQAEYEALIAGLKLALDLGVQRIVVKSDSQLLINQLSGDYQVKDSQLAKYLNLIQILKKRL